MIKLQREILGVLTAITFVLPAMAKVTIGPVELSLEIKNTTEVMSQIEKMQQIVEFKNTVCGVLGADLCNMVSNQIVTCTKAALKKVNKDIVDIDKANLMKAANSCAGDLYISQCIDTGYDALDDISKKQASMDKILSQMEKKGESLWDSGNRAYTNALTGETLSEKVSSTEKSVDKAESLYKQLGGGDVSKSYIGKATQKLFQQTVTPTKNMELVKACSMDALSAAEWVPSVTTLSSSEMAPTVPSQIKSILVKTEEGSGDLISKAQAGGAGTADTINDVLGGVTSAIESGFNAINTTQKKYDSAASLYKQGEKALTNVRDADNLNDALQGGNQIVQVVGKVGDKTGISSYFDPLSDQSQSVVDSTKGTIQSGWDVVASSSAGQAAGGVIGGIKDGIEGGSSLVASGVAAVSDKVSEVEEGIASLVLAGMKKTTDAAASAILGKPADINDIRSNQNQLQINALSSGIGNGLKSSALVGASGEEVAERSDKIEMSSDIFNMLKEIAGLSAQSLQKNNAITAMKAQLLEMGALDNIISGGVLNRSEIGG